MTMLDKFRKKGENLRDYLQFGYKETWQNLALLAQDARNLGFKGVLKAIYDDLVVGRSLLEWTYLLALSIVPIVVALRASDSTIAGFIASITGVINVILVAEGRKSNYLFGAISTSIYLVLAVGNGFYGEVVTNVYFVIMQPVGLYVWLMADRRRGQGVASTTDEVSPVNAKRMGLIDWVLALAQTAVVWILMGFAYQSIGAQRPFRDSVTDGTNVVGQKLMTELYAEQWIFWIATNIFSIYLWWGTGGSIDIVVMYLLYTVNSIVGMYRWNVQAQSSH